MGPFGAGKIEIPAEGKKRSTTESTDRLAALEDKVAQLENIIRATRIVSADVATAIVHTIDEGPPGEQRTTERVIAKLEELIVALDKVPVETKSPAEDLCRQFLSDVIKRRTPAQKAVQRAMSGL